ncbi:MAG: TIR domain-containing protein [Caulobacteraceae bacterium]
MSDGIFISYRRNDTSGFAGRLFDRLSKCFSPDQVFIDVQSIEPGANFADVLSRRVGDCKVLLALIGPRWHAADSHARLTDPKDYVRIEIEAALGGDVRVIPLLIDGARMPDAEALPASLQGLTERQAVEISHNRFDQDAEALVQTLRRFVEPPTRGPGAALEDGFGDRRAVAVLPFDNLSQDPAETYFVDGLTEEIITALAYWRWFPVVARNSTFAYKGKPKTSPDIGRELGAAYLVEGSARRSGDQVRITVQLIEAASGHHLFAERYDRGMTDVFVVQDEIAERIVASIEPEIHRAEARRAGRKHPSDLSAWDHALKALSLQERMTPTCHAEAREQLALALAIDPASARAWSLLSLCCYHEGILGWAESRDAALRSSLEAAEQAVACDDREWLAQALWGMGKLWIERDFASAFDGTERAVALNPSAPLARHFLACVLEFSGRAGEALPHLDAILRLDPRYRFRSLAIADQSLCHLLLGNLDEAISSAEAAVRTQPGNVRARQRLVAALSLGGMAERAQAAASELSRLQPALDVAYIDDTYPFMLDDERDRFVGALRASGLLETHA